MDLVQIILRGLLVICLIGMFFCVYMIYRTSQVYKIRMHFIDNTNKYYDLPSYNYMVNSLKPLSIEYWMEWVENTKSTT